MFEADVERWTGRRERSPDGDGVVVFEPATAAAPLGWTALVLRARGDVDLAAMREWRAVLGDISRDVAELDAVIVDLTDVDFLACRALPPLSVAHRRCAAGRAPLRVVADATIVRRVLDVGGLTATVALHGAVGTALRCAFEVSEPVANSVRG